jgi:Flp pilus assembly secretin CpaC
MPYSRQIALINHRSISVQVTAETGHNAVTTAAMPNATALGAEPNDALNGLHGVSTLWGYHL